MRELYWISVLGNAHKWIELAVVFSVVLIFIVLVVLIIEYTDNEEVLRLTRKWLVIGLCSLIVSSVVYVFIPAKKDLYLIYGVGKTLDYLQSNEDAKELPDNVIKTLNKLAEEYAKEDEK